MKNVFRLTVLFGACLAVNAGSVCPAAGGANPFPHPPDPAGTGCNVVITIPASGPAVVTIPDPIAYENSEDVLVGVKNNSATPVGSLALTGSSIFGLEGDGICIYTFVGSSYCSASAQAGTDPQDYYGPTTTFTITDPNTGTVNFSPSVAANGGTAYFSLEGVPTANLNVVVGGPGPTTPGPSNTQTVPTLGEWGMIGLGGLLAISAGLLIRRKAA